MWKLTRGNLATRVRDMYVSYRVMFCIFFAEEKRKYLRILRKFEVKSRKVLSTFVRIYFLILTQNLGQTVSPS